jgi:glucose-6-phosphate dehydrogenase assembly protein OpcA
VLDTVTARYPSRAIVLHFTEDPERRIGAEVSALCHLVAAGEPQVCSERIVLSAGPRAIDQLPGAIRPLLEADLPFVLWWVDDPRHQDALFRDLGDECSRLILDLPDPGTDPEALRFGLDPAITPYSRDTAWFGLTRWRELVAQLFDPPCHTDPLARLGSVRIEVLTPQADPPPRLALWLAAWMAGQLGWQQKDRPQRNAAGLHASFTGPAGTTDVEIVPLIDSTQAAPRIQGVTLKTHPTANGSETFHLFHPSIQSDEIRIEITSADYCTLPRSVIAPPLDHARRVSAALESSRYDESFQHALPHLFWLLENS